MFFRRARHQKTTFADILKRVRDTGFATKELSGGRIEVQRNGLAAVIADGGEKPRVVDRAGLIIDGEIASLVDGGFQKFLQTPSGVRKPALATELKAIHEFQEDLREALGLTSLYNESLGSVSNLYLYDRVKDRDRDCAKKPWELALRGSDSRPK